MSFDGYFSGDRVGYVYLMATPCLPGWVKIGRSNNPERRCKELSTAVPDPFCIEALWVTDDPVGAEAVLHRYMRDCRTKSATEFFEVDRSVLLEVDEFGAIVGVQGSMEQLIDDLDSVLEHNDIDAKLCICEHVPAMRSMYRVMRRQVDNDR